MAISVETWTTRLEALQKAAASGTLIVRHGDTQVTYRSLDELMKAIAYAESQINKLNGVSGRSPRYVQQNDKGL